MSSMGALVSRRSWRQVAFGTVRRSRRLRGESVSVPPDSQTGDTRTNRSRKRSLGETRVTDSGFEEGSDWPSKRRRRNARDNSSVESNGRSPSSDEKTEEPSAHSSTMTKTISLSPSPMESSRQTDLTTAPLYPKNMKLRRSARIQQREDAQSNSEEVESSIEIMPTKAVSTEPRGKSKRKRKRLRLVTSSSKSKRLTTTTTPPLPLATKPPIVKTSIFEELQKLSILNDCELAGRRQSSMRCAYEFGDGWTLEMDSCLGRSNGEVKDAIAIISQELTLARVKATLKSDKNVVMVWIKDSGGQMVAAGFLQKDPVMRRLNIEMLATDFDHRGLGFGSVLLRLCQFQMRLLQKDYDLFVCAAEHALAFWGKPRFKFRYAHHALLHSYEVDAEKKGSVKHLIWTGSMQEAADELVELMTNFKF